MVGMFASLVVLMFYLFSNPNSDVHHHRGVSGAPRLYGLQVLPVHAADRFDAGLYAGDVH